MKKPLLVEDLTECTMKHPPSVYTGNYIFLVKVRFRVDCESNLFQSGRNQNWEDWLIKFANKPIKTEIIKKKGKTEICSLHSHDFHAALTCICLYKGRLVFVSSFKIESICLFKSLGIKYFFGFWQDEVYSRIAWGHLNGTKIPEGPLPGVRIEKNLRKETPCVPNNCGTLQ